MCTFFQKSKLTSLLSIFYITDISFISYMRKYFPILIQIIHDIIAESKEKEKELSSEIFVTIPKKRACIGFSMQTHLFQSY